MRTHKQNELIRLLNQEQQRHGSFNRLSRVLGVSNATVSNCTSGKWNLISDEMLDSLLAKLGGDSRADWVVADTLNVKQMHQVINTARQSRSFWAISHKAGSGKTAAIRLYAQRLPQGVYVIQAQEWTQRQFMVQLCRSLGIEPAKGYNSIAMMLDQVVDYFIARTSENPLLIIDEADKLKDSAKRMIIPIYNRLEDQLACVWAGTENLANEIKRGVRSAKKGFDEIDSRFGRTYISLVGATIRDCEAICQANGINDNQVAARIFADSRPVSAVMGGHSLKVVEDMRRIKRLIVAEKALNNQNQMKFQFAE